MGIRADLEAAPVLALVHVRVHVADDRELDHALRVLEMRHGADVDHLVHGRRERNRGTGHACDARAPHAAADDDEVGRDIAARGADAGDAPVLDVDADHLGVREDRERAQLLRLLARERPEAQRIDDADARRVEAAEDHRLLHVRDELLHLRRRDQLAPFDPPRLRRGHPALQLLHALLGAGDLDAAALREHAPLRVLAHRLERQLRHLLRVVDREDEVRGVTGRTAGVRQRPLVDQHKVAPAERGEVVGQAVADDSGADDHRLGAVWELGYLRHTTDISRFQEHGTHLVFEAFDVQAHQLLGAPGVATQDRTEQLRVLVDGGL